MKNWKLIGPVTLKDTATGRLSTYSDIYDFCRSEYHLIIHGENSGKLIGDDSSLNSIWKKDSRGMTIPGSVRYLLLDCSGMIIPIWKIAETINQIGSDPEFLPYNIRLSLFGNKGHVYRRSPVPGTGKRSWRFGSFYRNPKTISERRLAVSLETDEDAKYYGVKIRRKRSKSRLPTNYDDTPRSDIRNKRNWKQRRKNHWT